MTRTPDLTTIRARIMAAMVRAALTAACARPPHHRAGRDGRMAPPRRGPNQRRSLDTGGNMPSNQSVWKPKLSPLHETGAGPRNPLNACAAPQLAGSPRAAIVEQPADAM